MSSPPVLPPTPGRIKRNLLAREFSWALVTPPAFARFAFEEARSLGLSAVLEEGSLTLVKGKLEDLYRSLIALRLPNRMYVRVATFRAGAREELYRKAFGIPWELWLGLATKPWSLLLKSELYHSRISHEGMAADTVFEALCDRLSAASCVPPQRAQTSDAADQRLLLRMVDNHAQISLDAVGRPLYQRGYKQEQGAAPLRDTSAAALVRWLGLVRASSHEQSQRTLVWDPFCGSGTLAFEAAAGLHSIPAMPSSPLAIQEWGCWIPQRYAYLQRTLQSSTVPLGHLVYASDKSQAMHSMVLRNLSRFEVLCGFDPGIRSECLDFLDQGQRASVISKVEASNGAAFGRKLILANPPYGERLDQDRQVLRALEQVSASEFKTWELCIIAPREHSFMPRSWKLKASLDFENGGLPVRAYHFSA